MSWSLMFLRFSMQICSCFGFSHAFKLFTARVKATNSLLFLMFCCDVLFVFISIKNIFCLFLQLLIINFVEMPASCWRHIF